MSDHNINWLPLIAAAKNASHNAYAPYSQFFVGAAALTETEEVVSGCNVENASYGLTMCAERNCLAHGLVSGDKSFSAIVIYTAQETLTPPCGACRQVIAEFMLPTAPVMAVNHLNKQKIWTVQELLPDAFTPKNLTESSNNKDRN